MHDCYKAYTSLRPLQTLKERRFLSRFYTRFHPRDPNSSSWACRHISLLSTSPSSHNPIDSRYAITILHYSWRTLSNNNYIIALHYP